MSKAFLIGAAIVGTITYYVIPDAHAAVSYHQIQNAIENDESARKSTYLRNRDEKVEAVESLQGKPRAEGRKTGGWADRTPYEAPSPYQQQGYGNSSSYSNQTGGYESGGDSYGRRDSNQQQDSGGNLWGF